MTSVSARKKRREIIKNRNYFEDFACWRHVHERFGGDCPVKEPKFVWADYYTGGYDGRALVIVSNNGRTFKIVEGSHCSCYGLEGQWDSTIYGVRALRKMLTAKAGMFATRAEDITKWIKRIHPKRKLTTEAILRATAERFGPALESLADS